MNDINTQAAAPQKQDFFETIYGVLFYPNETFDDLKHDPPILQALGIVIAVSILNPLISSSSGPDQSLGWFVFILFNAGISGLIKWVFFAAFVEALASIFKKGGQIKVFLTLSAFALLPWIFIGPVSLLKTGGIFTSLIGIIFGLAIWLWTTVLTIFAAMKAYEISSGRILLLVSAPFIGGVIFFNWIIGFFSTLIQLLKV